MNSRLTILIDKLLRRSDSLSLEDSDRLLIRRAADALTELSKEQEVIDPFSFDEAKEHVREIIRLSQGVTLYLSTAENAEKEEDVDCPMCDGEGYVDRDLYENIDNFPLTVGIYGIGDGMTMARDYVNAVKPSLLIPLLEQLLNLSDPNAQRILQDDQLKSLVAVQRIHMKRLAEERDKAKHDLMRYKEYHEKGTTRA
jgi:hypothetical protein